VVVVVVCGGGGGVVVCLLFFSFSVLIFIFPRENIPHLNMYHFRTDN
jgi:hypothetical protein